MELYHHKNKQSSPFELLWWCEASECYLLVVFAVGLVDRHFLEDRIDQAVLDHFVLIEPLVAIAVFGDAVDGLTGLLGIDAVEAVADAEHFAGFDFKVGGLTFHYAAQQGLVHEIAGVGERVAFALGAGAGEDAAHAGGLADDVGGDIALKETHGVEHGKAGGNTATGRVDVKVDVRFGIFVGEEEELGDDNI